MKIGKIKKKVVTWATRVCASFAASPLLIHTVRPYLYRLAGYNVHPKSRIRDGVIIKYGDRGWINMPKGTVVSQGCFFDTAGGIDIGEHVTVGHFAHVYSGTHAVMPSVYRLDLLNLELKPVRIERGCWIGGRATILPGVTVAEGCVIAAGSVVAKSTEPNGLYAGVPARRIKDLPIETDKPYHGGVPVDIVPY